LAIRNLRSGATEPKVESVAPKLACAIDLERAFSIIESSEEVEDVVVRLRDLIGLDHYVYHSSKLGASPSVEPYIRLTYPASWIKRYLQMNYVDVDPVLKEGFQRTIPFDWRELTISTPQEIALLMDALAHGVGPNGLSVPVRSKHGHRGLVSMTSACERSEWQSFCAASLASLVEIANRLHRRVIADEFGEDQPHLSARELECLRWTAQGKEAGDIATILDISPHTVRDYLKSARYKLDSVTSAQAVSKAVKIGLLTL
jgi:DNA-binding CsgD family transcriptional regulator